jgi:hypothetical protein
LRNLRQKGIIHVHLGNTEQYSLFEAFLDAVRLQFLQQQTEFFRQRAYRPDVRHQVGRYIERGKVPDSSGKTYAAGAATVVAYVAGHTLIKKNAAMRAGTGAAVIECVPAVLKDVVSVAEPELRVPVPSAVEPS